MNRAPFPAVSTIPRAAAGGLCLLLLLTAPPASAADPLDRLGEALTVSALDGRVRARLSGLLDVEGYAVTRPSPGLIETQHAFLLNPRLSGFLDLELGSQVYGFVQARVDRGFDPADRRLEARVDEYFLRWTLANDPNFRLAVQGGKFATVVGNWVPRHLSWENPFITAPLPYENITSAADYEGPTSASQFLRFRGEASERYNWLPVIWGPSYTSGLAVTGQLAGHFDYAVEIKNAALSARPEVWDLTQHGPGHPTGSGRLGWRPAPDWNVGVSASAGPYLSEEAQEDLQPGRGLGDYLQYTLGQDFAYAHGHWQVWAEAFESRFEVPNVGNADTLAYYVEARYKLGPQLFGALRWNQQLYAAIRNDLGGRAAWGNDLWRTDGAVGYRFNEHFQGKLQGSYGREHDPGGERTVALGAVQVTTKF